MLLLEPARALQDSPRLKRTLTRGLLVSSRFLFGRQPLYDPRSRISNSISLFFTTTTTLVMQNFGGTNELNAIQRLAVTIFSMLVFTIFSTIIWNSLYQYKEGKAELRNDWLLVTGRWVSELGRRPTSDFRPLLLPPDPHSRFALRSFFRWKKEEAFRSATYYTETKRKPAADSPRGSERDDEDDEDDAHGDQELGFSTKGDSLRTSMARDRDRYRDGSRKIASATSKDALMTQTTMTQTRTPKTFGERFRDDCHFRTSFCRFADRCCLFATFTIYLVTFVVICTTSSEQDLYGRLDTEIAINDAVESLNLNRTMMGTLKAGWI